MPAFILCVWDSCEYHSYKDNGCHGRGSGKAAVGCQFSGRKGNDADVGTDLSRLRSDRVSDGEAFYGIVLGKAECLGGKMSKKSDNYYFKNFVICAEYGEEAARMLERNLKEFDVTHLSERLDEIHGIEHAAEKKKHEMLAALVKEFITPIEREDIILLSEAIDEVTDTIEDVMIRLYINNIRMIRPDAEAFAHLITRCCKTLSRLMEEFKNFKKSKKLYGLMVELHTLEGEGDRLFIQAMRRLHTEGSDSLEVIVWREIYIYLEKCCDACEHTANAAERVILKNT